MEGLERSAGIEKNKSELLDSSEQVKRLTSEMSPVTIDGHFTVERYSQLNTKDVGVDDRVYIRTRSGNTYRLDKSVSRPHLSKIQNEQLGEWEYSVPMPGNAELLVSLNKPFHYAAMNDPDDHSKGGRKMTSTSVVSIEVWRNYLKAVRDLEKSAKNWELPDNFGSAVAATAANAARGTIRSLDYTKEK